MSNGAAPVIVWFRQDFRLHDNPALHAAAATMQPVLCVYIHDEASEGLRPLGAASRWWLHHSLAALSAALQNLGARLDVLAGPAAQVLAGLVAECGATSVFWNRRYGGAEIALDTQIKAQLLANNVEARSFNSHLLIEPWDIRNKTGGEFKVFTPFWKACKAQRNWPGPLPAPKTLVAPQAFHNLHAATLEALNLLPRQPDWSGGLQAFWQPGEAAALARFKRFLAQGLQNYGADRNRPDLPNTSSLSPHLRFGEISPRQLVQSVETAAAEGSVTRADADKFLSEIGWREFAYHLLYHHPDLATRNFSARFDAFPWLEPDPAMLKAWRRGQTGYPIVDAGMRQLWQTGYMHNRVRMITASFLIKHLLIDWRVGEAWFWDTLCDADPANNAASWQWVAGSGADAAPYFRIFNPVLQGEKFDPKGDYVRSFVPELGRLPNAFLHKPWEAPPAVLQHAGITLGKTYPAPIVDHAKARLRALAAFAMIAAKPAV